MLRILFESRIKQRLALMVPQDTVDSLKCHNLLKTEENNGDIGDNPSSSTSPTLAPITLTPTLNEEKN